MTASCRELGLIQHRHSVGEICLYRKMGSTIGYVARISRLAGLAAGGNAYVEMVPRIDGEKYIWERYVTTVNTTDVRLVALEFVRQIGRDQGIVNEPSRLQRRPPRVDGIVSCELVIPSEPCGKWTLLSNDQVLAQSSQRWFMTAMDEIQFQLLRATRSNSSN